MGDTGSLTIGYVMSFLAVHYCMLPESVSSSNALPAVISISVLFVPLFDMTRVFLQRFIRRRPLFYPDKNHIHHKLVGLGCSHRRVCIILAIVTLLHLSMNIGLCNVVNINVLLGLNLLLGAMANMTLTTIRAISKVAYVILLCLTFMSCKTSEKILYLQDIQTNQTDSITNKADITIQPKDLISIVVSSKDPQLAALFNLPRVNYQAGSSTSFFNANNEILGYTVDANGYIDFPILGSIKVQGLTRTQLTSSLKEKLIAADLIKDPIVTVEFMNLHFSVMGEVTRPGQFAIDRDNITLLDALSMAGDLTIYGKRDGIYVIRTENDLRTTYPVDIRSAQMFKSPVFYLKQNDVVYVQPNNVRAGQSTINGNNIKSVSLWLSVLSFLTSLGILLFK